MKTNWYAFVDTGDMVALGEHESFHEADEVSPGNTVWIVDAEGARDWLVQLREALTKDGELK